MLNGANYGLNQYPTLPNAHIGAYQQTVRGESPATKQATQQSSNLLAAVLQNKGQ